MKKKLYDFSTGMAIIAVAAFALLFFIFGYHAFHGSVFSIVMCALLVLAAGFLVYYYVLSAPTLTDEGLRKGKLLIKKENLSPEAWYDPRFRESVYKLWDSSEIYSVMSQKELKKKLLRVEATPANRKKLEAYLGKDFPPAQKPPGMFAKRRKKNTTK